MVKKSRHAKGKKAVAARSAAADAAKTNAFFNQIEHQPPAQAPIPDDILKKSITEKIERIATIAAISAASARTKDAAITNAFFNQTENQPPIPNNTSKKSGNAKGKRTAATAESAATAAAKDAAITNTFFNQTENQPPIENNISKKSGNAEGKTTAATVESATTAAAKDAAIANELFHAIDKRLIPHNSLRISTVKEKEVIEMLNPFREAELNVQKSNGENGANPASYYQEDTKAINTPGIDFIADTSASSFDELGKQLKSSLDDAPEGTSPSDDWTHDFSMSNGNIDFWSYFDTKEELEEKAKRLEKCNKELAIFEDKQHMVMDVYKKDIERMKKEKAKVQNLISHNQMYNDIHRAEVEYFKEIIEKIRKDREP
ncbi:hypothetical protein FPQ18DRAFT_407945 [Pyronema domesticum]|nr:hypothetical protein FPQ18DRAFT_407945 [Pyronema domesticum]